MNAVWRLSGLETPPTRARLQSAPTYLQFAKLTGIVQKLYTPCQSVSFDFVIVHVVFYMLV